MYTSLRVQINILFAKNKMLLTIMYSVCQYLIKNDYLCECLIYCFIILYPYWAYCNIEKCET